MAEAVATIAHWGSKIESSPDIWRGAMLQPFVFMSNFRRVVLSLCISLFRSFSLIYKIEFMIFRFSTPCNFFSVAWSNLPLVVVVSVVSTYNAVITSQPLVSPAADLSHQVLIQRFDYHSVKFLY